MEFLLVLTSFFDFIFEGGVEMREGLNGAIAIVDTIVSLMLCPSRNPCILSMILTALSPFYL